MFLTPIITYRVLCWSSLARTHVKTLEIPQNQILRLISSSSRFVRNDRNRADLGVPSLPWGESQIAQITVIVHLQELHPYRSPPTTAVRRMMKMENENDDG